MTSRMREGPGSAMVGWFRRRWGSVRRRSRHGSERQVVLIPPRPESGPDINARDGGEARRRGSRPPKLADDRLLDDPLVLEPGEDRLGPGGPDPPRTDPGEQFATVRIGVQGRVGDLVEELEDERLLRALGGARGLGGEGWGVPSDVDGRGRGGHVARSGQARDAADGGSKLSPELDPVDVGVATGLFL